MMKIETLYAWICTEPNGDEGLPAILLGDVWFPAVGADKARMESFRPQIIATGLSARLVEFTSMITLETISNEH